MRDAFVRSLMEAAAKDESILLLTGDLGFGVLKKFWEAFPERFLNAGIAEQAMTGIAAGFALEGKKVFTYSIANFPTLRCIEQIRNDVAYHNANVKIVSVGAGFSYGALGMSHHATEDIAIMRALPGITVFTPCDPVETAAAVNDAIEKDGPCYLRLGRGGEKTYHQGELDSVAGKSFVLKKGSDTAILCVGGILGEALTAADMLEKHGISASVYSFPTVKPLDKYGVYVISDKFKYIFTVEEHSVVAGFGSAVCETLAERHTKSAVIRIGIHDVYASKVGSQAYLRRQYDLSADSIAAQVLDILSN